MKQSRFISLLLAVVMTVSAIFVPLTASAAIDLSEFNLNTVQRYYLRLIGSLSRADYYKTDVLGSVTLAQAIYEGGWGRYSLPVGGNNLFGIKAYSTWEGMVYDQKTSTLYSSYNDYLFTEGQGHINTYSAWRAHKNWAESVAVHSALFANESKYHAVIGEKDYKVAAKAIVDAGYCDDYGYVDTVIKLIEQYGLTEYDDLTPDEDGVVAVVTDPERVFLDIGGSYTVPLTFYPETAVASEVVWASDNESVATVDENGNVTAVAHGMTLITATLKNGREACCIVYVDCNATVIDKDATVYTSPSLDAGNVGKIYRGTAIKVTEETVYNDGKGNKFYNVSGYNSKGELVSGYADATYIYRNKRAVGNIALTKDDITLKTGDTYTVKTAVSPADAFDTELIWVSDNDGIASVENGVITANAVGETVVTAKTAGGCERKIKVTVANEYREYRAVVSGYENITVRTEPTSAATRAGKLDYLTEVKVIGEPVGEWYFINGRDKDGKEIRGYANSIYVRLIPDEATVTYGTAKSGVTVYSESDEYSISYGSLKEGSTYALLHEDKESGWSYIIGVKTNNEALHGYARLDNSGNTETPPVEDDEIPAGSYYGRTLSELNVRESGANGSNSLGIFAKGTQIIITGEAEDGWFAVRGLDKNGNEVSGYSSAQYITVLYSGKVNATSLNVRAEAVSGEVVGRFKNSEMIIVVGEAVDGWYSVESLDGSIKGYSSADYIKIEGKLLAKEEEEDPVDPPIPPDPPKPKPEFEITDKTLSIENGVLHGVKLDTTVAELKNGFSEGVVIADRSGNIMQDSAFVGTGCSIIFVSEGIGEKKADVLVMGDVDGDGTVTAYDYLFVSRHFFGTFVLDELSLEAALVSGRGELNVIDYVLIKRHFFGTYVIGQ